MTNQGVKLGLQLSNSPGDSIRETALRPAAVGNERGDGGEDSQGWFKNLSAFGQMTGVRLT